MSLNDVYTQQANEKKRKAKIEAIAHALEALATRAEKLDLRLANGGYVDSWLTEIANEILASNLVERDR